MVYCILTSVDSLELISGNVKFYSEDSPSLTVISGLERKIEKRIRELEIRKRWCDH